MRRSGLCILLLSLLLITVHAQENESAATLIDDFEGYNDLAERWWMYDDEAGTTFNASLDQEVVYNGEASLRLDIQLTEQGYAGFGTDYAFSHDWRAGQGLVFQMQSTQTGFPL